MKINPNHLFNSLNDVRKYLSVSMSDELQEEIAEEMGIDYEDIETILNHASIYVNLTSLPETIELKIIDGLYEDDEKIKENSNE